jgi:hypothetical protein
MTEEEWLTARYSDPLLQFIEPKVTDRKLHYFDIACARRIAALLPDPASLHGIEVIERCVEGLCSWKEAAPLSWDVEGAAFSVEHGQAPYQEAAEQLPYDLISELVADPEYETRTPRDVLIAAAYFIDRIFGSVPQERRFRNWPPSSRGSLFQPVFLVHELFGNPFRTATFDREWRTSTAVLLAEQMYDSRDFSAMSILADALQDAGCDNADILDHCRGPGPHVRGCWVVDLVLGKE